MLFIDKNNVKNLALWVDYKDNEIKFLFLNLNLFKVLSTFEIPKV